VRGRPLEDTFAYRELGLGLRRHAELLADCIVELEPQQHRLGRIARLHAQRKDHTAEVTNGNAARLLDALRHRPLHDHLCEIL
jgi:hypothetical protein